MRKDNILKKESISKILFQPVKLMAAAYFTIRNNEIEIKLRTAASGDQDASKQICPNLLCLMRRTVGGIN